MMNGHIQNSKYLSKRDKTSFVFTFSRLVEDVERRLMKGTRKDKAHRNFQQ